MSKVDEIIKHNDRIRNSYDQVNMGGEMVKDFMKYQDNHAGADPRKTVQDVTRYYNPAWKNKVVK